MHGVDIARMVQTHVTGGGVGAALVLTSQCDSPTRGTSRDLGDYLSIFCGSHHPPITMYLPSQEKLKPESSFSGVCWANKNCWQKGLSVERAL